MEQHDLLWIRDREPAADEEAPAERRIRRHELLSHIDGSLSFVPLRTSRERQARPGRRRMIASRRVFAFSAGLAAAVLAAAVAILPGGGGPSSAWTAAAAPLTQLAESIDGSAAPAGGDATLVLREHDIQGKGHTSGADLYTDDGRYFYADTREALATVSLSHGDQRDVAMGRILSALEKGAGATPQEARRLLADAAPITLYEHLKDPEAAEALEARLAEAAEVGGEPAGRRSQIENHLWIRSMDALAAAPNRPAVRAGVLRVLATIPDVQVQEEGQDDQGLLRLRNSGFPDDYVETLTIDPTTGVLLSFTGGREGADPDVRIQYRVERVVAADELASP